MNLVQPNLTLLNQGKVQRIHSLALTVLEKCGIRADSKKSRQIFKKNSEIKVKNDTVFIPKEVTEWAIRSAPERIEILNRDGSSAFVLDSKAQHQAVFGIGVTNLYYQEALGDDVVPFEQEHMAQATRLGSYLDEFDTIATPGVIQNSEAKDAELLGFLEMLANTQKPLTLLTAEPVAFEQCLVMCDELLGEKATQSSIIPYFNPITPLILNEETTSKMEIAISRGMPFIFSNYGMSGATCPISSGGTLVLLMAELLGGLVFSQLLQEGTPIILGSLPAAFDMKSMQSFYTPQSIMVNLACAEMMAHYEIPHCGTSGGWMGRGPDLLASSMLWQNHLTHVLGKGGLIPFVGNNFDSMVFSPTTVVYAAEVIRLAREYVKGFSLEDEEIGIDEIIKLGPGTSFLTSELTLKHCRSPIPKSKIWSFLSLDSWQSQGNPRTDDFLRQYTLDLLNSLPCPEYNNHILKSGLDFIRRISQ